MKKRIITLLLAAAMLLSLLPAAAATNTREPSSDAPGSFEEAKTINTNQRYTDNISDSNDNDYFCFTLSSAGTVSMSFERASVFSQNEYWVAWLYNDQTEEICAYSFDGVSTSSTTYTVGLPAGTFYLRIAGGDYFYGYSHRYSTENYTFEVVYTQTDYAEKENNEAFTTATDIALNQSYTASINDEDDNDYYKFTLSKAGTVSLKFDREMLTDAKEYWVAWLYNDQTEEICAYSFDGVSTSSTTYMVGLPAGTFYLRIVGGDYFYGYSHRYSTENYTFEVVYTQTDYAEKENNEAFTTATDIALNQSYTASINDEDDNDYYKFTLSKAGTVSLKFDRKMLTDANEYWVAWLYNDQTEEICAYSFDGANTSTTTYTIGLPAGTFYLRIVGGDYFYGYSHRYSTEDYTFEVVYTQTGYAEKENNETFATATDIVLNQSYTASINDASDKDYYKFSLEEDSELSIIFENPELASKDEYWVVNIFDNQNKKITSFSIYGSNTKTITEPLAFSAGDYYLLITGGDYYYDYSHRHSTESYKVTVSDGTSHTHSYTDVITPPTCTEQGYTTHTCACGDSYVDSYVNALGHDYGDWTQTKAPTCTEKGKEKRTCSRCGASEIREIAAKGHTEVTDAAVPATCTEAGKTEGKHCSVCGAIIAAQEEIAALGHDYGTWTQTKAPTCTDKGKEKSVCSRCGASEIRDIAAKGHTEVTDAAVAPTCTETGLSAGKHCSVCNAILVAQKTVAALGHEFKDGVCTVCGAADPNNKPSTPSTTCDGGAGCPSRTFTDVSANSWYHLAVDFAVKNGLFGGMSSTTFEPDTAMTRAMLVTVLWRYEGKPTAPANRFSDVPANAWYTDAVSWAASVGVVDGVGNNRFDPDGNITREQMAAILYRFSNNKGVDTSSRSSLSVFPDGSKTSSWAIEAVKWTVAEGIIGGSNGKLLPQGNATRAQVATILMRYINMISDTPTGDNAQDPANRPTDSFTYRDAIEAAIFDTKQYDYNYVGSGTGMLYDINDDGVCELILLYEAPINFYDDSSAIPTAVCSVYTLDGKAAVPLLEKKVMYSTAGGAVNQVSIVEIDGTKYFATMYDEGGHYYDADYDYSEGQWELYTLTNGSLKKRLTIEYGCMFSEKINYKESHATFDGVEMGYAYYEQWLRSMTEIATIYTWKEGTPLSDLLNLVSEQQSRYEFVIGKYSWLEAQDAARAKGGYLVNFNTQEEYFSVLSEIEVLGYQDVYFRIGGRRIGDSKEYYWVGADGATYGDCLNADNAWCLSLWQDGEPNFEWKSTREEFMEIFFSEDDNRWVWNDVGNQQTYPLDPTKTGFIIEYDAP